MGGAGLKWMLHAGLTAAAFCDWDRGKIPNRLTAAVALAGGGYRLIDCGIGSLLEAVGRGSLLLALLFPLYLFRMMGAGDIKLVSAAGVFLSGDELLSLLAGTLLLAGAWSLWTMGREKIAGQRFRYLIFYIRGLFAGGGRIAYRTGTTDAKETIRMGPFLWAGMTLILMGGAG